MPGTVRRREDEGFDADAFARFCAATGVRLVRDGDLLVIEGDVPCYAVKKLAASAAGLLSGAPYVVNRLRVVPRDRRPDAEILRAVRQALQARRVLRGAAPKAPGNGSTGSAA